MVKLSAADVGTRRTFKNGAVAEVVAGTHPKTGNTVYLYRIVSGATAGSRSPRRSISPRAAKIAFTKYWKKHLAAAGYTGKYKHGRISTKSPAVKGVLSARARDLLYKSPVRDTTSFYGGKTCRKTGFSPKGRPCGPGRFDHSGFDFGKLEYKKASGARAAALAAGRAKLAAKRA